MRTPAYLEFRCRVHERRTPHCDACDFVQQIEKQTEKLHEQRRRLLAVVKARLGEHGDILVVGML